MNDQIDDLKILWNDAKQSADDSSARIESLVRLARTKKQNNNKTLILNMFVLIITLVGISAFFIYVANFRLLISHIGIGLMTGSLVLRIIIELFSLYLSSGIDMSETALKTNNAFLKFYQFRKRIHGPVTLAILLAYSIGFYLLTPEFSLYFDLPVMILLDLSYIVAALIFTWFVLIAIKNELIDLKEINRILEEIQS